jgi:hypothetical protein
MTPELIARVDAWLAARGATCVQKLYFSGFGRNSKK